MSHNTNMEEALLRLFPLETVMLPHGELRLHIFEERYKEMIGECLDGRADFGVVQMRGGGVMRVGCTASIEEVLKKYADGRMDILTVGRRRFALQDVDTERSFLRGEVEYFGDESDEAAEPRLVRDTLAAWLELMRLKGRDDEPPDMDHPELSFLLAQISTDPMFRQRLLETRNEKERMEASLAHLQRQAEKEKARAVMAKVVRSNGHGKHVPAPPEK